MRVVTPPTIEPLSLAEVKLQLGVNDDVLDAILTRRITAAREWVESYCDRALAQQVIEERFDSFPGCRGPITLQRPEVVEVESIKYLDYAGIVQTIDHSLYELDTYDCQGVIRPALDTYWPTPRTEPNAVRVQYTSGYGVIPLDEAKTVTAASNATPGTFTANGHGFVNGDVIMMAATGMTEIDGKVYAIYNKSTNTFQLANLYRTAGLSTASYGTFTAGTAQKVMVDVPPAIIDAIINIIGHWTNYQAQIENGSHISQVPSAIRRILDNYRTRFI